MQHRSELDWVRAISMLGVVMIHASAGFIFRNSRISLMGGGNPCSILQPGRAGRRPPVFPAFGPEPGP